MSQFLAEYGMFLLKAATIVAAVVVVMLAAAAASRKAAHDGLEIEHLNKKYKLIADALRNAVLPKSERKKNAKARRKEAKAESKHPTARPRSFVIDFKGDLKASAVPSLREEVSAVLDVVDDGDEVIVRLENHGGLVHEHGLAASQLARIRDRGIPLVICVDKVAASGGYLMACVASKVYAAPFAILGSIGVLAQIPNFNRMLDSHGVDFEQVTAGKYKRTLTLFGKNTDEGREKIKEELEDVHDLFKAQIAEHRPQLDIDAVATGEHWYGLRALSLNLVDEIGTSDDYLIEAAVDHDLYSVVYRRRRSLPERVMGGVDSLLSR